MMASYAWVLEVRPGYEEEYKKRHDEIWPEMVETLHRFGIRNYSIYRDGLRLFAYLECDDPAVLAGQRDDPVVQRWWRMMEPYMKYNADGTPWSASIDEVFHLD
jgi:L-rhamnose mutarotase